MCIALPGRVVAVDADGCVARVDVLGHERTVNLSLEDDVVPGEWVLVRTGFAVARMSPADAAEAVELLEELGAVLAGPGAPGGHGRLREHLESVPRRVRAAV